MASLIVDKKQMEAAILTFHVHDCLWCVSEFMSSPCACGCRLKVASVGHFRKDCRRRITAAGRVCKPNVRSASAKRRALKHAPNKNFKNNPKNNPKYNKKRKLTLRAANLKEVQDDPTLNLTLKMSTGTSASVSDWTHMTHSLESHDSPAHSID